MHFEVTRPAPAPAAAVWSAMVDVERWPMWTRSMQRVELLTEGPLALGSRVQVKQPRLAGTTWVVTELDPGRSFTWRSVSPGITSTAVHEVTPGPAGTSSIRLSLDQVGPLAGVLGVVFSGLIRRYVQMEADGLASAAADPGDG
jgi:uncharacterized membrane protein